MALTVKLQVFEGPLDLLLHLIDKNKVDIYDIPIVEITDQYLQYIRLMRIEKDGGYPGEDKEREGSAGEASSVDDMNVMSEFLVMAATLLDIKCRMLLPAAINEEGEEEDPRAELVQKLLEYKMYKYMSMELKDRQVDAQRNLFKMPTIPGEILEYRPPVDYAQLLGGANLKLLHELFRNVLKRQEDKIDPIRSTFGQVEKDEIDMELKTVYVEEFLKHHPRFGFAELLERQQSKMEIIVTFLVILELMKMGKIMITQADICDDILIIVQEVHSTG